MNKGSSITGGEMTCLSEDACQTVLDAGMTRLSDESDGTMLATSLAASTAQPPNAAADKEQQERYKPGDYIGERYEVLAIHKGALGVVYAVYDHKDELPKALKTLQKQYAANKSVSELFYEEAALWVILEKHPYIVRAYGVDLFEEQPYVVMEYVAGRNGNDLRSWLGSPRLTLSAAVEIALKIAQGMQYVQQKVPGLVHRDLKPANILVDEYAQPYITDFGLAFAAGADAGTPAYMAPEQWAKGSLTIQTDIYAYGCILYEMLTGHRMYAAAAPAEWRQMHLTEQPVAPSVLKPEIPMELERFVLGCLEKKKERRPQSWDEVVEVMAGWFYQLTGQSPVMDFSSYNLSAVELVTAACSLVNLDKYPEALATSDKIINADPGWVNGWYMKGIVQMELKLDDQLLDCYNHILELDPDLHSHQHLILKVDGAILYRLKRYEEALTCYELMLDKMPLEDELWNYKGAVLSKLKRCNEALECFDQALEINPGNKEALWNKCIELHDLERYDEALDYCIRYLELNPNDSDAWRRKGTLLVNLEYDAESLECFDRSLFLNPDQHLAYFNKAVALNKLERYQEAIDCCDKCVEYQPDKANIYSKKAFCLGALNRFEEALKYINQAIELEPDNYLSFCQKAHTLHNMERYQEAVRCCDMAIELNQFSDDAWSCKRCSLEELYGADSLSLFDQALEVYPSNKYVWKEKGIILFHQKRSEEAINCFDRALEMDSDFYDALKFKGYSLYQQNNKKDALQYLCRASEINSSDCSVIYYRGILFDKFKNYEAALESFDHILGLLPEDADYLSSKGRTLYHLERYQEAVQCCDKALAIAPQDTWGLEYKGKSLKKLNLHEEGDACLKKLLELKPGLDIWDDY